jgi:hypothetical protein
MRRRLADCRTTFDLPKHLYRAKSGVDGSGLHSFVASTGLARNIERRHADRSTTPYSGFMFAAFITFAHF